MDDKAVDQKWWQHYQHDRDLLTAQVNQLTRDVSALTADVKNLLANQKDIIARGNRPFQWGAFVSAIVGAGVFAGLLIHPIQTELEKQEAFDQRIIEHMVQDSREMGEVQANLEWLKIGEDRAYTHHETEWNRVENRSDEDLIRDLDRLHDCSENTKQMLIDMFRSGSCKQDED